MGKIATVVAAVVVVVVVVVVVTVLTGSGHQQWQQPVEKRVGMVMV